jgi:hypothetical protein
MSSAMAALGVSLVPRTPETLIEEVGCLPGVVRELELSTSRRVVHWILAMIESHYQGLDHTTLSSSWPLASSTTNVTNWRWTAPPSPAIWPMLH